jgi:branched-subunit amino acid ABC-type transport system permease component
LIPYAPYLVGLLNGSFCAVLSLGLAVIFGMLDIINFIHGAPYMIGAFVAYFFLGYAGVGHCCWRRSWSASAA